MQFNIKLANRIIKINSLYDNIYDLCRDYIVDEPFDFSVDMIYDDILYEKNKYMKEENIDHINEQIYPDSYFEILAVYRKIALSMIDYDTILFHASSIALDGEAYLFTAKSGVGKSTHTKLWMEYFGDRAVVINDDKPLLKICDDKIYVCGTPWDGKHKLSNNIIFPLKAIAILERDNKNHISKIDKMTALPMLIQQTYRPNDPIKLSKVLDLINKIGDNINLYRLGCNMDIEAAKVSYNGMKEG